ncbi:MAG: ROK family protein [Propionibacteriaceae bacterium]|jgi:predicted NBD/HSP70 family sugar kinase|nr:ROK family protein [Propionibacteriaceae bacterium]
MLSLGIDVGGTKAEAVTLDAEGKILARQVVPTMKGAEGVYQTIGALTGRMQECLGVEAKAFTSVGVGIPGLVDPATGVVKTAVNLDLAEAPLKAMLERDFSVPVAIENDVKATALGALRFARTPASLTYINIGTGFSTATVMDGRVLRGKSNGAGELGHLVVEPGGDLCGCGQHGCVETVVGGKYLTVRMQGLGVDLRALFNTDTDRAKAEVKRILCAMRTLVEAVLTAYDPEAIVLGGGIVEAAPWLTEAVKTVFEEDAKESEFIAGLDPAARIFELRTSDPVAAIGAALVGRI